MTTEPIQPDEPTLAMEPVGSSSVPSVTPPAPAPAGEPAGGPPSRRVNWLWPLVALISVLALIGAGLYVFQTLTNTARELNPFTTERRTQIERQATTEIKDRRSLVVDRLELNNIKITQTDTNKYVPDFIWKRQAEYQISGWVDVEIDTSKIKISLDENGVATVSIPQPVLSEPPGIDPSRSDKLDQSCGLLNFRCTSEALAIFQTAQGKFREQAKADPNLMPRARAQAEQILRGLLMAAGAKSVTFDWAPQS